MRCVIDDGDWIWGGGVGTIRGLSRTGSFKLPEKVHQGISRKCLTWKYLQFVTTSIKRGASFSASYSPSHSSCRFALRSTKQQQKSSSCLDSPTTGSSTSPCSTTSKEVHVQ